MYLRYGTPGGVRTGTGFAGEGTQGLSANQIRQLIREEMMARGTMRVAPEMAGPGLSAAEIRALVREEVERERPRGADEDVDAELLERRIADRVAERLERRMNDLEDEDSERRLLLEEQRLRERDLLLRRDLDDEEDIDAGALEARLDALEERLENRIDEAAERVREQRAPVQRAAPEPERMREEEREEVMVREMEQADTVRTGPFYERYDWDVERIRPYIGAAFDPGQFVGGGRLNLGPVTPNSPFDLVPEVAFSFGDDDPILLALANLRYGFGTFTGLNLSPYVMGGLGIHTEDLLAASLAYGTGFDLDLGVPLRLFLEHQGINFFDRNRVLLGISFAR